MTSYFGKQNSCLYLLKTSYSCLDELGITSTQKKKIVDVDLDAFMNPTPASQHSNSVETNVQQLIQTAK
jgi:hypothetical protein